jgi:hypothetical protein
MSNAANCLITRKSIAKLGFALRVALRCDRAVKRRIWSGIAQNPAGSLSKRLAWQPIDRVLPDPDDLEA